MLSLLAKGARLFVGENGGATNSELADMHYHNNFSKYLPWMVYDKQSRLYMNSDETVGYMWECTPLCFSAEKTVQTSDALMRLPLPNGTLIQFILHADKDIKSFIDDYRYLRKDGNELIKASCESYVEFLKGCTHGLPQLAHIPLRNFRLFVTVKFPKDMKDTNLPEIHSLIHEILNGIGLGPKYLEPPQLLDWARRFFNDDMGAMYVETEKGRKYTSETYNDNMPLSLQVIRGETDIEVEPSYIRIGKKYLRSITPKDYPNEVNPLQTNELFGGIWGVRSDNNQHRTPFIYALNIVFEDLKNTVRTKCDLVLQQHGIGSWARTLARKQDEYQWAIDRLDQGEKMCRIIPVMFFIGETIEEVNDAVTRGKRMWEEHAYNMQEDKYILLPLLLSTLPFGLRQIGRAHV